MTRQTAPITDFLTVYAASGTSRLHMPGHKGIAPDGYPDFLSAAFPYDLTEIAGADELYEPEGIIAQSEAITASLYHSGYSCYSAGGSTLSILSMVTAAVRKCGREIIAVRNAHLAFVNACVHCDAEIHWLVPEYDRETGLCLPVTAVEIERCMQAHPEAKIVYLTSPDYYGVQADVGAIAKVVHARGGILLCDNAHGAHLIAFDGVHPMAAGADLCCDSPHKTLPVLTGGSILHCGKEMAKRLTKSELKRLMTMYGSTSPSYLIMASLEQAVLWMQRDGIGSFQQLGRRMEQLSRQLRQMGIILLDRVTDCTKLTLDAYRCGYTSDELSYELRRFKMEPEFSGGGKVVLMFSPQTDAETFERLLRFGQSLKKRSPIGYPDFALSPERVMPLREAAFAPSVEVDTANAQGKVAAENRIACPPGIPVVTGGEKIGAAEKKMLLDSGIFRINVLK